MNRQILEEASAWFVDFRVGDVDAAARARFDEWLRRSPEHVRAYIEVAQTYVALPPQGAGQEINVSQLISCARTDDNVVALEPSRVARTVEDSSPAFTRDEAPQRRAHVRARVAASIALVTVFTGAVAWFIQTWDPTYVTEIGERRSITLKDGSTVDLNARSRIRVHFSDSGRHVELLDGEALFQVAKDKARPFIVTSAGASVRAVGTQFEVDRRVRGTVVTVVEGLVTVTGGGAMRPRQESRDGRETPTGSVMAPAQTYLSAGEQVTIVDGVVAAPRRANIAETTAWMQHRLIFDGSRLIEVVDEFNRYNTRQLVVEPGVLDDIHISGVYSSTDPASLIRFLREQPGVRIVESHKVVRITRP